MQRCGMTRIRSNWLPGILALAILSLLGACTRHSAYRVPDTVIRTNTVDLASDPVHREDVAHHCIEDHERFSVGFVEFDDQGEFWSREQFNAVEQLVLDEADRAGTEGVLMITFVHGWKHNASVCDENVSCFREVLKSIYNLEQLSAMLTNTLPRRIVGIYVGWRGLSVTPPVLKELSFYSRKSTAHRVGRGQVLEVFTRLEDIRNRINQDGSGRSKLVVVGHSFGAALTYSALAGIFEERAARSNFDAAGGHADARVAGFGDLVLLVNPAFEAARYTSIHQLSVSRDNYASSQPAVLMVVSSDTDTATKIFFPIGRFFSTLFKRTRDSTQKEALKTTIGNYEPYRTHSGRTAKARGADEEAPLFLDDVVELDDEAARGADDCQCRYIEVDVLTPSELQLYLSTKMPELANAAAQQQFADVILELANGDIDELNPFPVVRVTDEIVTAHNGIYNKTFIDFLRAYMLDMEKRANSESPSVVATTTKVGRKLSN